MRDGIILTQVTNTLNQVDDLILRHTRELFLFSFILIQFQSILGHGQQPGNPRRWLRRHARRVRIPGRRNVSCD